MIRIHNRNIMHNILLLIVICSMLSSLPAQTNVNREELRQQALDRLVKEYEEKDKHDKQQQQQVQEYYEWKHTPTMAWSFFVIMILSIIICAAMVATIFNIPLEMFFVCLLVLVMSLIIQFKMDF